MAENSKISWTHHTQNLWIGCTHVHAGCDNCYAETLARRWGNHVWGADKPRKIVKNSTDNFRRFQRLAAKAGEQHRVFVGSMMDIFEKSMPLIESSGQPYQLGDGFKLYTHYLQRHYFEFVVPETPNLLHLMLTKRPSNINHQIPQEWKTDPPQNVMFGTSPVDQKTYDTLKRQLLGVNGYRFLSIEPQLGAIDLGDLTGIHWVIQGGESGHGVRPFDPAWATSIREQCRAHGVAYFFKQTGSVLAKQWGLASAKGDNPDEWSVSLHVQEFPVLTSMANYERQN